MPMGDVRHGGAERAGGGCTREPSGTPGERQDGVAIPARSLSAVQQVEDILGRLCKCKPNSPELLIQTLYSCTPDVVLDTRFALADGQIYEGRRGVEEFFMDWLSCWREWSWEVIDVFDTPNGVVVSVEETAVSRLRIPVSQTHVQQWQMKGGKVKHWTMFSAAFRPDLNESRLVVAA